MAISNAQKVTSTIKHKKGDSATLHENLPVEKNTSVSNTDMCLIRQALEGQNDLNFYRNAIKEIPDLYIGHQQSIYKLIEEQKDYSQITREYPECQYAIGAYEHFKKSQLRSDALGKVVYLGSAGNMKIGNRTHKFCMIYIGTKEIYKETEGTDLVIQKQEDRHRRCMIPGTRKGLIRCPETKNCAICPYRNSKPSYESDSLYRYDKNNGWTEKGFTDPQGSAHDSLWNNREFVLNEMIHHAQQIAVEQNLQIEKDTIAEIFRLRADGKSYEDVGKAIGWGKTKVKKILDLLYDHMRD